MEAEGAAHAAGLRAGDLVVGISHWPLPADADLFEVHATGPFSLPSSPLLSLSLSLSLLSFFLYLDPPSAL